MIDYQIDSMITDHYLFNMGNGSIDVIRIHTSVYLIHKNHIDTVLV
jgi:hypothetical protein